MKNLIFTLLMMISISNLHAQKKFTWGLELGVNASNIPFKKTTKKESSNYSYKNIHKSVISPRIGLWSKMELTRKLYFNLGIQYFKTGYSETDDATNKAFLTGSYLSYEEQTIHIHKLSAPISIGYKTKIANKKIYFGAGYKRQYHLSAFYNTYMKDQYSGPPYTVEKNKNYNLLNKSDNYYQIKRWNDGFFFECGFCFNNKIGLELNYGINNNLDFLGNQGGDVAGGDFIDNKDISICFKYTLNMKKK